MSSHMLENLKSGELAHAGLLPHLSELIRESLENKSELKGLSHIEIFSHYIRKNKFQFQQFLEQEQLAVKLNSRKQYPDYFLKSQQLSQSLKQLQQNKSFLRPDLQAQYQALKTAGITVGETNVFHLNKVLKKIAIENQVKQIRFWGKILGYQDYWIIQGVSSKNYFNEVKENEQKYGVGVNFYSYWVSTDILGTWVELPLISSEQVKASRTFKYLFSGNLQKGINSFGFAGQEKHLLKAIVCRITHSCELIPKGIYKPNEENGSLIDLQEEWKYGEISQMNSLDGWVHLNQNILNQGRCSHYIDPKLGEAEKEALVAELAEKDPIIERLKGVADDKPYEAFGYATNWTVSLQGQTVPVNQIGKQEGQSFLYGVALLKNLVWPGASTVGYRGGWVNIYVGYGHRISQQNLFIKELKDLQVEGEEKQERSEPNPSKVPVIQEKKQEVVPSQ